MSALNLSHNSREINRNSTVIINMRGKITEISDPENPKGEPHIFSFDYSYWSHDDFKERGDGYLEPNNQKYADQVSGLLFFLEFPCCRVEAGQSSVCCIDTVVIFFAYNIINYNLHFICGVINI